MPAHVTHFVYLVPTDKTPRAAAGIALAVRHLRAWYQNQMNTVPAIGMKTFTPATPLVLTVYTNQNSAWYSTNNAGGDSSGWYWANTLQHLWDYCRGGWYQPYDNWVVYNEAPIGPNQYAGGTTPNNTNGICVMHGKDCAAMAGQDPDWTVCREIGGSGHELGHSFGLPHPDGHPLYGRAIMGTGYTIYANCILVAANKWHLHRNPFFTVQPLRTPPHNLCPFQVLGPGLPDPDPGPDTDRPRQSLEMGVVSFANSFNNEDYLTIAKPTTSVPKQAVLISNVKTPVMGSTLTATPPNASTS